MTLEKMGDQGWIFQGNYSEPRLGELTQLYIKLGFDVRTIPAREDKSQGCKTCFDQSCETLVGLYTKKLT